MGCASEWGIPMNYLYTCTKCGEHGLLVFIITETLPITIMVLLIIIFNIQLTNGSINGVVLYSQNNSIKLFCFSYYNYNPVLTPTEIPCSVC